MKHLFGLHNKWKDNQVQIASFQDLSLITTRMNVLVSWYI